MTLRQHYYPEGEWGWLLVAIGFIIQCLSHGLHMSIGVLNTIIASRFQQDLLHASESTNKEKRTISTIRSDFHKSNSIVSFTFRFNWINIDMRSIVHITHYHSFMSQKIDETSGYCWRYDNHIGLLVHIICATIPSAIL